MTDNAVHRWRIWLKQLGVMGVKEFLQLGRDVVLMVFVVYLFTVDIYMQGGGISLELRNAITVVYDADRSEASRELIDRFRKPYFQLGRVLINATEGERLLDRGKAMVMLEIPPRFQESVLAGEPTEVLAQVDTSNSVLGLSAASYAERIVGRYSLERATDRLRSMGGGRATWPRIDDDTRVWYNPTMRSSWFLSVSELLQVVTMLSIILPAAAMVREKERGTVEQLLVSPLSPFQIMFPKILSMTLVILTGTLVSLFVIMEPFFAVPMKGSLALFLLVTALYTFTTAGIGLFVSTIARNLAQVGMLSMLIVAPMIFLSGAFTPPEAMPGWLRAMVVLSPLNYYIKASFGILLKGAGLKILWDSIAAMALLGGIIFGFGIWRFRRQFG